MGVLTGGIIVYFSFVNTEAVLCYTADIITKAVIPSGHLLIRSEGLRNSDQRKMEKQKERIKRKERNKEE